MATIRTVRLHPNYLYGTLSDNMLGNSGADGTMNSAALASAPVTTTSGSYPTYFVVVLDPQSQIGAPEIVYVTVHTSTATTATVVRGQEGSSIRAHDSGEFWVATETSLDYTKYSCSAKLTHANVALTQNVVTGFALTAVEDYWSMLTAGADGAVSGGGHVTVPVYGEYLIIWAAYAFGVGKVDTFWRAYTYVNGVSATPENVSYLNANTDSVAVGRVYLNAGDTVTPAVSTTQTSMQMDNDLKVTRFSISLQDLC